jgi:toxin-antitoxin system PIN domain toxin
VFVVDTNVLVYGADQDPLHHQPCRQLLEDCRRQPAAWFLTWSIIYEFLRVTTHLRVMRRPWRVLDAWQFVDALLASPGVTILVPTDRHAAVAAQVLGDHPYLSGNLLFDAQTAILMREHGIRRIYTRDADFHRFPFLEPIDPAV